MDILTRASAGRSVIASFADSRPCPPHAGSSRASRLATRGSTRTSCIRSCARPCGRSWVSWLPRRTRPGPTRRAHWATSCATRTHSARRSSRAGPSTDWSASSSAARATTSRTGTLHACCTRRHACSTAGVQHGGQRRSTGRHGSKRVPRPCPQVFAPQGRPLLSGQPVRLSLLPDGPHDPPLLGPGVPAREIPRRDDPEILQADPFKGAVTGAIGGNVGLVTSHAHPDRGWTARRG